MPNAIAFAFIVKEPKFWTMSTTGVYRGEFGRLFEKMSHRYGFFVDVGVLVSSHC